jgi:hypothetical protein
VERVVEDDDRRPARGSARELDRVLDGFRAGVEEDRLLLCPRARGKLGEPPADVDVGLVHADHEALVQIAVGLLVDRVDDRPEPVAGVLAGDPAREVDERPAVDGGHARALCSADDQPRRRHRTRDEPRAIRQHALRGARLRRLHRAIIATSRPTRHCAVTRTDDRATVCDDYPQCRRS